MKRLAMWFFLLSKRLYKKATFLIILALIPLMILGLGIVAKEDSGFITIALAQEDASDAVSSAIVEDLTGKQRVIRFVECETPEEARQLVAGSRADAAWVFPKNMQGRIQSFLKTHSQRDYIVTVYQREQTVALRLSHEKLAGALYTHCAQTLYLNFAREETPELDGLTDEQVMSYYFGFELKEELFRFAYPDDSRMEETTSEAGYLVTPVRGLLSVFVLLGGLAAAMFYMQDERRGVFAWVRQSRLPLVSAGCQLIAVLNLSVVMVVSLAVIGMTGSLLREMVSLVMYVLCCTAFCTLIAQLCRRIRVLGMVTPPLIVSMVVVCPIFFNLGALRKLQLLFPPTYYLNAVNSDRFLLYGFVYFAACTALSLSLGRVLKKR